MVAIECVVDAKARLGEGPLWDPRAQVLWWLDIKGHHIHRFDPASGEDRTWNTPEDIG
jgi:sugar lactone lactonase YvrE